jgi:hypothetical protein
VAELAGLQGRWNVMMSLQASVFAEEMQRRASDNAASHRVIDEQLATLVRIVADAVRRSSPQAHRRTQSRRTGARAASRTRSSRKMGRQGVVSAPQTHQKIRKRKSGTAAPAAGDEWSSTIKDQYFVGQLICFTINPNIIWTASESRWTWVILILRSFQIQPAV